MKTYTCYRLSRLFYFNNEGWNTTLLKERQTRTSTSLLMKKIKRRLFHRKRKVYFQRTHQYQILLYQEGIKNHLTTDQNLIKESASH
jgi:hypothetical protein